MLCLNLLTIQGPTIYNVSAAACHLLRSERRRTLTVVAAGVGILLAIGGMYEMLILSWCCWAALFRPSAALSSPTTGFIAAAAIRAAHRPLTTL